MIARMTAVAALMLLSALPAAAGEIQVRPSAGPNAVTRATERASQTLPQSTDSRSVYDHGSSRWLTIDGDPSGIVTLFVSKTGDLDRGWWSYALDFSLNGSQRTTTEFRAPTIGLDSIAVYIMGTQYTRGAAPVLKGTKVRMLSKALLYSGEPVSWTDFLRLKDSSGLPTRDPQALGGSDAGYQFTTRSESEVTLWTIQGTPSSPALRGQGRASASRSTPELRRPGGSASETPGIAFTLPARGDATIVLVSADGRVVRTIGVVDAAAGPNTVRWDGLDARGVIAPSGVYWGRVTSGKTTQISRVVLIH